MVKYLIVFALLLIPCFKSEAATTTVTTLETTKSEMSAVAAKDMTGETVSSESHVTSCDMDHHRLSDGLLIYIVTCLLVFTLGILI